MLKNGVKTQKNQKFKSKLLVVIPLAYSLCCVGMRVFAVTSRMTNLELYVMNLEYR